MKKYVIILSLLLLGCTSPEDKKVLEVVQSVYGGEAYLYKGKSTEDLSKIFYVIEVKNSPIINDTNSRLNLIAGNCALMHFEILNDKEKEECLSTEVVLVRNNRDFKFNYKKDYLEKVLISKKIAMLFLKFLKNKEFEKAYTLFSPDIKKELSFETFSSSFLEILNWTGNVNNILIQGTTSWKTVNNTVLFSIETVIVGQSNKYFFNFFIDPTTEFPIIKLSNKKNK